MRILFFGGTGFVGRHAVAACLAREHEVTLVCRGLSDPTAFPGVARITGERTDPRCLAPLDQRAFDAVIDTCGYLPREVRASVGAVLAGSAHYVFVSSVSVYADLSTPPTETTRLADPVDGDDAVLTATSYGGLKVACERAVQDALGERACIVRPGRILGPYDSDPRVPWLLRRIAEGGEVPVPGDPDGPVQLIDARDLAAFLVDCAERRTPGVFNAVSPPFPARELYDAARAATRSDARFTWVPDEILVAHGVVPFSEAPFWLPRAVQAALRADSSRGIKRGLSFRPVVDTLRDEWSWMQTGWDAAATVRAQKKLDIKAGLSPERERALLEAVAP
jgi:2'-hydroxyisoflavone reductase